MLSRGIINPARMRIKIALDPGGRIIAKPYAAKGPITSVSMTTTRETTMLMKRCRSKFDSVHAIKKFDHVSSDNSISPLCFGLRADPRSANSGRMTTAENAIRITYERALLNLDNSVPVFHEAHYYKRYD
jgi:hypothetical protein